jgi:hypothetical protein
MWNWPDGRIALLSLDGGAPGDAPSLGVVYSTAALRERKQ